MRMLQVAGRSGRGPGPRSTNVFSIVIQIRWKIRFTLTSILKQWSLQTFVHGTTAVLSWHVQKNCDLVASNGITARRSWIVGKKSLVKRAPEQTAKYMRKTTHLKSGWGFGQKNSPLSTARVLIDAVGLCLLRVSEVWRLFAPDLMRWINSFSGSDFKPRLVYKTLYFCYFFTNFGQQF